MKNYYLLLSLLNVSIALTAQTLSPSVLPSCGAYINTGGHSLSWSLGELSTITLSAAGNKLTQGFQQPEIDLRTGNIDSNTVCVGIPLFIPYSVTGFIGANNVFTAQLSDSSGSFSNPVYIGSDTGNTSGIINATIPLNTPPGNNYRIRVTASLPSLISNGQALLTMQECIITFNLKAFVEGYYAGNNLMRPVLLNSGVSMDSTLCDSAIVSLHDQFSPYIVMATDTVVLKIDGTASLLFPYTLVGGSYYLSIRTRNTIETWSKLPVTIGLNTNFDFTAP